MLTCEDVALRVCSAWLDRGVIGAVLTRFATSKRPARNGQRSLSAAGGVSSSAAKSSRRSARGQALRNHTWVLVDRPVWTRLAAGVPFVVGAIGTDGGVVEALRLLLALGAQQDPDRTPLRSNGYRDTYLHYPAVVTRGRAGREWALHHADRAARSGPTSHASARPAATTNGHVAVRRPASQLLRSGRNRRGRGGAGRVTTRSTSVPRVPPEWRSRPALDLRTWHLMRC